MALHPDIEGFLELAEFGRLSGKSQPMHQLSPAQARQQFEQTSQLLDEAPDGALTVTEVSIAARDGHLLKARLYAKPQAGTQALPVLLYFHGGGYVVGSLDSHDTLCRRLALAGEFSVLTADYRLAPEHRFPTAYQDAEDVTRWLAATGAAELGLDAGRVALAGDSVGGSLVASLCIAISQDPLAWPLVPRLQVLLYPVIDAVQKRPSLARFAEGYLLEATTLEWFYQQYQRSPADRSDWRFSPLHAERLQRLTPTVLWLAEYDPLLDEGLAWAEKLRAVGQPLVLEVKAGMTHDFARMGEMVQEVPGMLNQLAQQISESLA
ncbi:alpha/beta hydrolase [Pseudomonas vancouverensis]|uniref:Alpha/beta hydrolase n=1 Tax=Pseudomonas vancouverensis TaxID=95300 RepID=A0A1H2MJL8_PSEVA|nr:alpha/beta hydrolase [Pseudomonas vancouverensis]KAB0494811.1 alpha/beta hydrolase [Pseudomonas vancouverensis]TDB63547.1 alpha/beta hydrolase [Pseudomonas vancouverensis]SDU93168.1 acetyl esterase [Pseudomonas vancouverensis]